MNTLFLQNCEITVDEVHSTARIYQNLEIPSFYALSVWIIISHQHTNKNKASNTNKILISNMKYLKLLRIYSSAVNIKISAEFLLVLLFQVFHGSGGKSYFDTRTRVNCSVFILLLQILCILVHVSFYLC